MASLRSLANGNPSGRRNIVRRLGCTAARSDGTPFAPLLQSGGAGPLADGAACGPMCAPFRDQEPFPGGPGYATAGDFQNIVVLPFRKGIPGESATARGLCAARIN